MMYIDTNIIIYAIERDPVYGEKCKKIIFDIQEGRLKACSSFLVLMELIGVLARKNIKLPQDEKRDVRKVVTAVTSLPIVWLDIDLFVLERAAGYDYRVAGLDYIHMAAMEINMVPLIISADKELDKVPTIKRIDPLEYMIP